MRERDLTVATDHERASQLRRIADGSTLNHPVLGRGEHALGHDRRTEELRRRSPLGSDRLVADPLLIGQHRYIDSPATPEVLCLTWGRLTDQHETAAGGFELLPSAVQLHR